jgi:hypothetical protein
VASMRPRGVARKTGINPLPIVVYIAVAVVVAGGMYAWDLQYRRAEEARRRPPEPEVIARNLVENVIGADTVKEVRVVRDRKLVAVTFASVLYKPERAKAELRELLEAEGTLATQAILATMRDIDRVAATLVHQGRTLVIVEAERGRDRVTTTIVDDGLRN